MHPADHEPDHEPDHDPQRQRPSRTPLGIARQVWALTLGVGHGAWRLVRNRRSMHDREAPPSAESAAAPDSTTPGPDEQPEAEGSGPRFRRRFQVTVREPGRDAAAVMAEIQADPNRIAPEGFASFHKEVGQPGVMIEGDEFLVDLLGPWTNRVRVAAVSPTSFRLATLQGHVEAGHVDIALHDEPGALVAEVSTRTRSKDRLLDVLYDRIGVVRLLQTEMWAQVCEHAGALAGGRAEPLRIDDQRLSNPGGAETA